MGHVLNVERGHFLGEKFPAGTPVFVSDRGDGYVDIRLPDGITFTGELGHDVVEHTAHLQNWPAYGSGNACRQDGDAVTLDELRQLGDYGRQRDAIGCSDCREIFAARNS